MGAHSETVGFRWLPVSRSGRLSSRDWAPILAADEEPPDCMAAFKASARAVSRPRSSAGDKRCSMVASRRWYSWLADGAPAASARPVTDCGCPLLDATLVSAAWVPRPADK